MKCIGCGRKVSYQITRTGICAKCLGKYPDRKPLELSDLNFVKQPTYTRNCKYCDREVIRLVISTKNGFACKECQRIHRVEDVRRRRALKKI